MLIPGEAPAGSKANPAHAEARKWPDSAMVSLYIAGVLQNRANATVLVWERVWREAIPLALELQSGLEILRKFLFFA